MYFVWRSLHISNANSTLFHLPRGLNHYGFSEIALNHGPFWYAKRDGNLVGSRATLILIHRRKWMRITSSRRTANHRIAEKIGSRYTDEPTLSSFIGLTSFEYFCYKRNIRRSFLFSLYFIFIFCLLFTWPLILNVHGLSTKSRLLLDASYQPVRNVHFCGAQQRRWLM